MPIPRAFVGIYHDMDTVENMLDAIQPRTAMPTLQLNRNPMAAALHEVDFKMALARATVPVIARYKNPSEDAIQDVRMRMSEVACQRNTYIPVARLNPDVLREILSVHLASLNRPGLDPWEVAHCRITWLLRYTQVCRYWRTLVQHIPSWWTEPWLAVPDLAKYTSDFCGRLPLKLSIGGNMGASRCIPLFNRARTINLDLSPSVGQKMVYNRLNKGLPNLEELRVTRISDLPVLTTSRFPMLRTFEAPYSALQYVDTFDHWSLTSLTLSGPRFQTAVTSRRILLGLVGMPQLQYITLRGCGGASLPVDMTVHLPHLRELVVQDDATFCRNIMACLVVPSTVSLSLHPDWSIMPINADGSLTPTALDIVQSVERIYHGTLHRRLDVVERVTLRWSLPSGGTGQHIAVLVIGAMPSVWTLDHARVTHLRRVLVAHICVETFAISGHYTGVLPICVPELVTRLLHPALINLRLDFPVLTNPQTTLDRISERLIPYHDRLKQTSRKKLVVVTFRANTLITPSALKDVLDVEME